ncbi:hypothetical protein HPB47_009980 [Ixodes persulcatus]|uniref:Uncharacterized protein n=1 Tax=Ixodes persulcatus TaxID=34615 RepID=A0AC60P0G2_IXOPE|nr:hypothetical protein HPB47_009980 [Ixodes persulcatus]
MLGRPRGNIYAFVHLLKKGEATSRGSLLQLSNGGQARKRLKRWKNKDESIKDLEERLRDRLQQKAQTDGTHGTSEPRTDEQKLCTMMQRRRRAGRQAMAGAIHHVVFVTY